MAEAKWSGVLSTTEPRNDVGIIKVRQGNINSEIAEFQIVQNNKPYDLTGLTVYFCASFGLNLVEKTAVVINTTGGRIQYTFDDDSMQSVGRQKGYFSIKKAESKIDSTQEFEFQVESSLMTRSIDGKSYIYKLSTLIKVLDDFIKNGQNNFNTWFDSVKEILYGVDPGGNILRELIEARKNSSGNIFASLKARLDKNEDDTAAQLAQTNAMIDTKASINYVDAILMDIAKGGPKALFNSVAILKSTHPNGAEGTYLVMDSSFTDGAHSFMWDSINSTWKDLGVYQATGVGDKTVTPIKTTFIHEDKTLNLFDRYTVKENVFIQGDTGFEVANSNYCASDYIPVIGGKTYSSNLPAGLGKAFYDANKNRIAGDTLVAPTNARFLRVTTPNPVPLDIMVVEGNATPEHYLPHILTSIDREVKVLKESLPDGKYVEKENVDFIEKDNSINIFNRNTVKKGVFIVGNTGYEEARAGYGASDYIPVTGGVKYSSNIPSGLGKAFYNINKQYIVGDTLTAPVNAAFLRMTTPDPVTTEAMLVEGEFVPSVYVPYGIQYNLEGINVKSDKRRWEDEIITFFGDSITAGLATTRTYWQYANEKMKAKILINAISSTEISTGGTYPNPFISRYTQIDSRSKLIVVFGGVNDFEHNVELGTFDSRDNATFYGALHNLCNGLYTNYPDAQYAFFTPLQQAYLTPNAKGYVLTDYVDAIIKVCGFYGIPVLDLNRKSGIYPMNTVNKAKYMSDGTHPNALGHKRFAPIAASFLESL